MAYTSTDFDADYEFLYKGVDLQNAYVLKLYEICNGLAPTPGSLEETALQTNVTTAAVLTASEEADLFNEIIPLLDEADYTATLRRYFPSYYGNFAVLVQQFALLIGAYISDPGVETDMFFILERYGRSSDWLISDEAFYKVPADLTKAIAAAKDEIENAIDTI